MKIVTHPDNIEKVKSLIGRESEDSEIIHTISSIQVVGDPIIEKERKTGKCLVIWDGYEKWWDGTGKPPQWAINFGFIKPETVPVFYEVRTPTIFNPNKPARNWAR